MEVRGADTERVQTVCLDLSPSFISATCEFFPKTLLLFDRYPITALLNKAVDEVRRFGQNSNKALKKSMYLWLKNPVRLDLKQKSTLEYRSSLCPSIGMAYRLKEQLREIGDVMDAKEGLNLLDV
jgi:transposase